VSYIDQAGKYHKDSPTMQTVMPQSTSVWKNSDHDRQRADHAWELVQPYLRNGEVNPEFLTAYPDESREMYGLLPTEEQLAKGQRTNG
jgi:hypothetical protein